MTNTMPPPNLGAPATKCFDVPIKREDEAGMIFLTSEKVPGMMLALFSEDQIHPCLHGALKSGLERTYGETQIFLNGSLKGPIIHAVAKQVELGIND